MPANLTELLRLLTLAAMLLATLSAFVIGVLFFFKQSGSQRANQIYATLLLACGGMQLHFLFAFAGYLDSFATLKFLPIYFSLSIPVLFFYYVKLTLYPTYIPRGSDIKHFILPLGQILYMFAIWLLPELRVPDGRYFYNPFYGGVEQALFISLFPLYIFFGYQYYRHRKGTKNRNSLPRLLWYVHKLLKGTMFFVLAYAIMGLSDFFVHKFLRIDLREQVWFTMISAASFTAMVYFFSGYGFQVLLWGRRLLRLEEESGRSSLKE